MNKGSIQPSLAEFRKLAKKGNLVPIYRELLADLETPVSAFLKVAAKEPSSFLLESVEYGNRLGRYSFIGIRPSLILESKNGEDILPKLEEHLKMYRPVSLSGLPSFYGGFVGFLNYDNVQHYEKIKLQKEIGTSFPEAVFFLADRLFIFDHVERTMKLVAVCHTEKGIERSYRAGVKSIDEMSRMLSRSITQRPPIEITRGQKTSRSALKPNMTRNEFESRVKTIKKYIHQGDCIQVVLSQRFDLGKIPDSFELYRALRSVNPSPYMFYFKHKDLTLVGSSPEVLVKKTGKKAEVRPIAGTRRRGKTEEEDRMMEEELRHSEKELAEHLMLVDLGRNDLGRVCKFESVKVDAYARVERYSHVMHLVSEVTGELRPKENAFSLLRSTFPAGTVSGAPKVRAMEIIDEQESVSRGPYAGSLGYFSFTGDMDMCIMIRTIVIKKDRAFVQAGAGIVYDSIPSREYQETVNKANALFSAVELTKKRN